jgi:hypothetical protein
MSGRHDITYEQSAPIEIRLQDGNLTLWLGLSSAFRSHDVTLREEAGLEIGIAQPLGMHQWHDEYFYPLANLVTLLTGARSVRSALRFEHPTIDGRAWEKSVEVVEAYNRERALDQPSDLHNMPTTYRDLEADLPTLIPAWLALSAVARAPLNVFFSVDQKPDMYVEQKFLCVMQALEGFHRTLDPCAGRDASHQERLREIMKSVPQEHRAWLGGCLAFSHEPSLRARIHALIEGCREAITPFVSDEEAFVRTVVKTRNYLVHRTPELAAGAATPDVLWKYCFVLSTLMKAVLFSRLLPSRPNASLLATTSPEYSYLRRSIRLP